jgi:hypothetical protein
MPIHSHTGTITWFDTIGGSGGLLTAAPIALPQERYELAEALGYWVPGDGGGGSFYWDASSTLVPDGGTVLQSQSNPGRWIRIYSGPLNVRWFGAYGDGKANDAPAIAAAIAAATTPRLGPASDSSNARVIGPDSATVYFPPGTYAVWSSDGSPAAPLVLVPEHSGVTLQGATDGGQYSQTPSKIQLQRTASSLLQISTTFLRVEDLWLDGNTLSNATVEFIAVEPPLPPLPTLGSVCSDVVFSRVLITGAGPATPTAGTGSLVLFSGNSEIDDVLFTRCQIRQYSLPTTLTAAITSTATTITVASSAYFPPPNFYVSIGSEILLVTATGGTNNTTWTVARHQKGTAAADAAPLAAVMLVSASTTLAAPITAAATTITVTMTSAAGFPPPNFYISIGSEILLVTAVGGAGNATWTVVRGQQNTAAATAAAGASLLNGFMVATAATACVYNNYNGQAFMINFEHCYLSDADNLVVIHAGACHFRHCVLENASSAVFSLDAVHTMIIEDCYIEDGNGTNGPFLFMDYLSNVSGPTPIVVRNCELNATTATLELNCTQPVILEGNMFKGNVKISLAGPTLPTSGYFPVVSIGNTFGVPGVGFMGATPGSAPPAGMLLQVP